MASYLFTLADKLQDLRAEKTALEARAKEIGNKERLKTYEIVTNFSLKKAKGNNGDITAVVFKKERALLPEEKTSLMKYAVDAKNIADSILKQYEASGALPDVEAIDEDDPF